MQYFVEFGKSFLPFGGARHSGFDPIDGYVPGKTLSLSQEMAWSAARISVMAEEINSVLESAAACDEAFWAGRLSDSRRILEEIAQESGQSIWLIERQMALAQLIDGTAGQKKLAADLKSMLRRTIAGYLIHYMSIRNEPSVSMRWFGDEIRRRTSKEIKDRPMAVYIAFRLLREWPVVETEIADILRVEQNHAEIDIYETFISVAQMIATTPRLSGHRERLKAELRQISAIHDFRIAKLLAHLDETAREGLALGGTSTLEALLRGDPRSVIANSREPREVLSEQIACVAVVRSCGPSADSLPSRPRQRVTEILSDVFRRDEQSARASEELLKFAVNFNSFREVSAIKPLAKKEVTAVDLEAIALHSPFRGAVDLALLPSTELGRIVASHGRMTDRFILASKTTGLFFEGSDEIRSLSNALASNRRGDRKGALTALADLRLSKTPFIRSAAASLEIRIRALEVDAPGILRLLAKEVVWFGSDALAAEAAAFLRSTGWTELKDSCEDLAIPIGLFITSSHLPGPKRSLLRFALDQLKEVYGVSRISELAHPGRFQLPELIFFLRNVCVSSILDMTRGLHSSRDVEEERRAILIALRQLDPAHRESYDFDILRITQSLTIEAGLRLVDSTRIYVDERSLRESERKDLAETFQRYALLAPSSPEDNRAFDEVLRAAIRQENLAKESLAFPDNEADDLLQRMIRDVHHRFLFDSHYGLDSYLSKRIRHGSIVGHLRGPLEVGGIVMQRKEAGGAYLEDALILETMADLSETSRDAMRRAFADFSASVDAEFVRLRDSVVHIHSREKLSGRISVDLTPAAYHLIRSVVRYDLDIDSFLTTMFASFWGLVIPSLAEIQREILSETSSVVADAFEQLRIAVQAHCRESARFGEYMMKIADISARAQSEIESVADWFQRSEQGDVANRYSLDQAIDVGIESAKLVFATSQPRISMVENPEFFMGFGEVPLVADVLLIALGNVSERAGDIVRPNVVVSGSFDAASETIQIDVVNEIAPGVDSDSNRAKVDAIRTLIASDKFVQGLRKEGESGLKKLAGIALQSTRGKLDFGFASGPTFFISISLSIIPDATSTY